MRWHCPALGVSRRSLPQTQDGLIWSITITLTEARAAPSALPHAPCASLRRCHQRRRMKRVHETSAILRHRRRRRRAQRLRVLLAPPAPAAAALKALTRSPCATGAAGGGARSASRVLLVAFLHCLHAVPLRQEVVLLVFEDGQRHADRLLVGGAGAGGLLDQHLRAQYGENL